MSDREALEEIPTLLLGKVISDFEGEFKGNY